MEQVVLNFGMVAIVVVDADSRFLSKFEAMCKILKLTFWPLSRGNHKGNLVEHYHRFPNKHRLFMAKTEGLMKCSIKMFVYHSTLETVHQSMIPIYRGV